MNKKEAAETFQATTVMPFIMKIEAFKVVKTSI